MNAETIAGLIIGVIGVAASIVTYYRTREDKHLDYEIALNTRLMMPGADSFEEGLELRYKSERINAPRLVVLRLINTGNRPIAPNDQIEPITIRFDFDHPQAPPAPILTAAVIKTGGQISARLRVQPTIVELEPVLFNQGDWIAIRFLIDGDAEPNIQGRVVGVKGLRPYKVPNPGGRLGLVTPVSAAIVAALLWGLFWALGPFAPTTTEPPDRAWALIFVGGLLIMLLTAIYVNRLYYKPAMRRAEAMRISLDDPLRS
jgi:hypothetical protein